MTGCSSVGPEDTILSRINDRGSLDKGLAELIDAGVAPAISVAVVKNGSTVYAKGFGYADESQTRTVTGNSAFNLWSISKVFTQLAVLDLIQSGKLQLDDPVCAHIQWLNAKACGPTAEHATTRTIRMLMDHTAGVPDIGMQLYGETQFESDRVPSQVALAKRLTPANKRWTEPGQESQYSNTHYLLLAAIVEQISGQPFSHYVKSRVLTPLGLTQSGFRYEPTAELMSGSHPVDFTSFFAFFYVDKAKAVRTKHAGRYWFNKVYNSSLGSTGVVSNGQDMARFMTAMLSCLRGTEGPIPPQSCNRISNAERVGVTKSPARGVADLTQQLGWFVYPTTLGDSYVHGGSGMGYTAMLQLFPEDNLGIFVVANDSYFDRKGGLGVATAVAKVKW